MDQWLPRGFDAIDNIRIRKIIASGDEWQIYITDKDTYVLAVVKELYDMWIKNNDILDGLFKSVDTSDERFVFVSKPDYLISSLDKGPFPENGQQVEAFAIAFNTSRLLGYNLEGALYIEEYSMILPIKDGTGDDGSTFGKWITGGVGISIQSFNDVRNIMSWISLDELKHAASSAGFDVNFEEELVSEKTEIIDDGESSESTFNVPKESFSLTGRTELEKFLNENIVDVLRNPKAYERMGIGFPGATILYGPPGCGKTFAVDKLVEYLGWERFDINSGSIGSPYIHETGRKITEIFDNAMAAAPAVLIIDEMEAYLSSRDTRETHHVEEVAEFLRKIPEAISKNVLVFGMTNMIDKIDPAILRRGRFDYLVEIQMASKEEIKELLKEKFNPLPIDDDVRVEEISEKLQKRPLSDVTFVLREAGRFAVKNRLETINQQCFNEALELLPKENNKEERRIGFR